MRLLLAVCGLLCGCGDPCAPFGRTYIGQFTYATSGGSTAVNVTLVLECSGATSPGNVWLNVKKARADDPFFECGPALCVDGVSGSLHVKGQPPVVNADGYLEVFFPNKIWLRTDPRDMAMSVTTDAMILSNSPRGTAGGSWSVEDPRPNPTGFPHPVTSYQSWALTKSAVDL